MQNWDTDACSDGLMLFSEEMILLLCAQKKREREIENGGCLTLFMIEKVTGPKFLKKFDVMLPFKI